MVFYNAAHLLNILVSAIYWQTFHISCSCLEQSEHEITFWYTQHFVYCETPLMFYKIMKRVFSDGASFAVINYSRFPRVLLVLVLILLLFRRLPLLIPPLLLFLLHLHLLFFV